MPRRAITAAVATTGGLALLLSFKTPAQTVPAATTTGAAADTTSTSTSTSTTAAPFGGSGDPTSTTTSTTVSSTATAASNAAYRDGTVAGGVVSTEWGDVQVQVTVKGGQITDVTALEVPFSHQRSQQINAYATPILHDEALTVQTAQVDTVSGATITSGAYAQSLQAALDQLAI